MQKFEFHQKALSLLEDSKTALLSTLDTNGYPSMRWMSPVFIPGKPDYIYAVTSPDFPKTLHIEKNFKVEWMFQTRSLTEILNIKGTAFLINNPALKNEIMEIVGHRLNVFWKLKENTEYIILETKAESYKYFIPGKGNFEYINLEGE
ncbi:MAG TPA: pyridoxamine 5'-phosphate oxidase family protein [Tepiditoga sp.]|nr:pyridoxamine 5'-phosphate oxidase family protein [Thermotogota bacterium]HOO73707.1 pyridoxamine 5'-phosphate oxidase family protein [Tepiditoga sp.]